MKIINPLCKVNKFRFTSKGLNAKDNISDNAIEEI